MGYNKSKKYSIGDKRAFSINLLDILEISFASLEMVCIIYFDFWSYFYYQYSKTPFVYIIVLK